MPTRRLAVVLTLTVFVGIITLGWTALAVLDLRGRVEHSERTIVVNQRGQCPSTHPSPARCRALLERLLQFGAPSQRAAARRAAARDARRLPAVVTAPRRLSPTSRTGLVNRRTASRGGGQRPPHGGGQHGATPTPNPSPPSAPSPPPGPQGSGVDRVLNTVTDVVHQATCPLIGC